MKITFVAEAYESLSIEYLSSTLKSKGYHVSLIYDPKLFNDAFFNVRWLYNKFFSQDQFIKQIIDSNPDIIAFSVMSETFIWSCKIAGEIKKISDIPIIFGGIHPTSCSDYVIREDVVDLICVGDGEMAMLELAERFDRTNSIDPSGIQNLFYKMNGKVMKNPIGHLVDDLDSLPFPDKHLFISKAPHMAKRYYIMTSRGCPFNCSYCYNSTIKNKKRFIRKRSVENVLGELQWALKSNINFSYVMFGDDTFVQDKEWLDAFLEGYRKYIHRPFVCMVHPRAIDNETLVLLKKSGCTDVNIGVQSINPDIRHDILNRPESNDEIFRAMKLIKNNGLRLLVDHIGGLPNETEKDYEDAIINYKKHRPNYIAFFWLAYYPETPILQTALNQGTLSENDRENIYKGIGLDGKGRFDIIKKEYLGFEFIFALIPLLPMSMIKFIIRHKLYRKIKIRAIGPMVFFPRFIRSIIDFNLRPFFRHIDRYMDLIHYLKRWYSR